MGINMKWYFILVVIFLTACKTTQQTSSTSTPIYVPKTDKEVITPSKQEQKEAIKEEKERDRFSKRNHRKRERNPF
jgi:uncharacterized lipoprotein YajG